MTKTYLYVLPAKYITLLEAMLGLNTAYFRTSSNEIQKTPSDAPCGIKDSLRCGVQIGESSDQSPFQE
jgi:hypothetical protein